jgi:hypothetical protein
MTLTEVEIYFRILLLVFQVLWHQLFHQNRVFKRSYADDTGMQIPGKVGQSRYDRLLPKGVICVLG